MKITASKLRQDLFRILDQVLETGVPVEIERNGETLQIVRVASRSKLSNLVERPSVLGCNPEDIVHLDWSKDWKP